MLNRTLALGLCLTALILSRGARVGAEHFSGAQEKGAALSLPQGEGAWLVEMTRSGGMRPGQEAVSINSDGEISVTSEHRAQGRTVVDCARKEKLSAEDLLKLKEAISAASLSAWVERYEDAKHPPCCDQPTTHLTLRRRGASGAESSHSTSWYPGSSSLRPADLVAVADAAQLAWNTAREHCGERARALLPTGKEHVRSQGAFARARAISRIH